VGGVQPNNIVVKVGRFRERIVELFNKARLGSLGNFGLFVFCLVGCRFLRVLKGVGELSLRFFWREFVGP